MKKEIRNCAECEWCTPVEDSKGRMFLFCMDADSVAFLEETELCGNCTKEVSEWE